MSVTNSEIGAYVDSLSDVGTPASNDELLIYDVSATTTKKVQASALAGGGGGSDLVQVASGAGSVRIPGILIADRVPASPNAADDEFDTLSGWTNLGTPNANATDAKSHLHMSNASPGTFQLHGIRKTAPSMPFTVTAKLTEMKWSAQYQGSFLMLLETGSGKIMQYGPLFPGGSNAFNLGYGVWASRTSRSSFTDNLALNSQRHTHGPVYIRLVVNSSTNIETWFSQNGLIWYSLNTGINPGFTVADVGLGISGQDNNVACDAYFDWVRFS